MKAEDNIRTIKGIGEKTAAAFQAASVFSVSDLLTYYPRTYETYEEPILIRDALHRDFATVQGIFLTKPVTRYIRKMKITEAVLFDEAEGKIKVVWFNMPYLTKTLNTGETYILRGKMDGVGVRRMVQPSIYKKDSYEHLRNSLVPIYPAKKNLRGVTIRKALEEVFQSDFPIPETLPENLIRDYGLCSYREAIFSIHFPKDKETFLTARNRLVFEEFYHFLKEVMAWKKETSSIRNEALIKDFTEVDRVLSNLPFRLTSSQGNAWADIKRDLSGETVMNRLLQGDVGSGKTIVSFLAVIAAVKNGFQAVLMAPTEILSAQHYENLLRLNEKHHLGLRIGLLLGSTKSAERKIIERDVSEGKIDVLIGTHAVFQERIKYPSLGLVITDEQHRFGVNQRKKLEEKGHFPHVLYLSATPIPRTLGMILYGDLDISVINELPKNRLPVKTAVVDISYRPKAYAFIRKEILDGHQAYIVCPMVHDSDTTEAESVTEYRKSLANAFPPRVVIEVLHGQMKAEEKEEIMGRFYRNEVSILLSTTVIEVGIDVKNATVMMVENAERFGLSQLHQLRGRVGRGEWQSYAILVDTTNTESSQKRLEILKNNNDGFQVSSEDLKMRGPGDFFGTRQSGALSFALADIYRDSELLMKAKEAAENAAYGDIYTHVKPTL